MAKWWQVFGKQESHANEKLELNNKITSLTEMISNLEAHGTSDPVLASQARAFAEHLKNNKSNQVLAVDSYRVASSYAAVYAKVSDSRKKNIKEVERMRAFYMVDVIINQLVEDSLAPQIGTGDIVVVSSDKPAIQKEIDLLEEKFDLDKLVQSIAPDLLAHGEYTLKTEVVASPNALKFANSKEAGESISEDQANINSPEEEENPDMDYGLIEIEDSVDQGTIVALTKYSDTVGYLKNTGKGKVERKGPSEYIKFSLTTQRMRLDLFKEFELDPDNIPTELKDMPRFIRIGRSMIYPIISKLKELELLESLVPAAKLSKLSNGSLVGVQVPGGMDINKALDATKQIEGLINKRVGVDQKLGEITVENILSTAGRVKVVPLFGEKGQLSKLDYKSNEPDDLLHSVEDLRRTILTAVGIPYELVYQGDGTNKGEILKKYARYLRKLKGIQKAIEEGLREIVYIHLANKGYKFTTEDVKVEFHNKLIEVDNLDKLEFIDTTVGLLKNVKDFIFDLGNPETSPGISDHIDVVGFLKFLNEQMNVVGFTNLIMNINDAAPGNPIPKPAVQDPSKTSNPIAKQKKNDTEQDHNILNIALNKPKKYISTSSQDQDDDTVDNTQSQQYKSGDPQISNKTTQGTI